jgi:hypothetical protein
VSQSLQILEFPLGCIISFCGGLVKDLGRAKFAAVVHVGGHGEPAFSQLAQEVDLARIFCLQLQRLLFDLVRQACFLTVLRNKTKLHHHCIVFFRFKECSLPSQNISNERRILSLRMFEEKRAPAKRVSIDKKLTKKSKDKIFRFISKNFYPNILKSPLNVL